MIRIGLIDIDVSHPKGFSEWFLKNGRAKYCAVYNSGFRDETELLNFARKAEVEKICSSVEEVADFADVGFVQGCNWDKHLEYAKAFISRGKPVFIDKPMVGCLSECRELVALEEAGATILGSSSYRYCKEVRDFHADPLEERGNILHIDMTVGMDEFNYAIHAWEGLCAFMACAPLSVRFMGASETNGIKCESYFVEFENGATACCHCVSPRFCRSHTIVVTEKKEYTFTIDNKALYDALLTAICDSLEGKENRMADVKTLIQPIQLALASKLSKLEARKVSLDDAKLEDVSFDGALFAKGYAENAKPIY